MNEKVMLSFIDDIGRPKYQVVSGTELVELQKVNKLSVSLKINRAKDQHLKVLEVYEKLAHSMKSNGKYYLVDCKDTVDPVLKMEDNTGDINVSFEGEYSLDNLKNFIKSNFR